MNDKEVKLDHIVKIIESGDLTMAKCLLLGSEDLFLSLENKEFCKLIGDVCDSPFLAEDEDQFISKNGMWRIECSESFTKCKMMLTISSNNGYFPVSPGEISMNYYDTNYNYDLFTDSPKFIATRIAMIKLCL